MPLDIAAFIVVLTMVATLTITRELSRLVDAKRETNRLLEMLYGEITAIRKRVKGSIAGDD